MLDVLSNINIQFYLAAYLISSIPFGYFLAKAFAGVDIKQSGSGNIGATNVLRVVKQKNPKLAKKLGAITLALDALKGAVIVLIAKWVGLEEGALWMIALLAVLGHCYSIFLGFEGGKGVATGFGVMVVLIPYAALVALMVWFIAAKILKISSLSSLLALAALIAASYLFYPDMPHTPIWIIVFIIFYKHLPNIIRLIKGEEKAVV